MKHILVFTKYALVGIVGTAIDVGSLYVFVDILHIPVLVATAGSFLLAAVNNFVLNKFWTFQNNSSSVRKQFIKFFIVSSIGLLLTEACMALLVYVCALWYIGSKLATSVIVLAWNFLANKYWTFKDAVRPPLALDAYPFELSIIIPAFNEERRIVRTLETIDRYFDKQGITREIIVIDDGSTDNTAGLVDAMSARIRGLHVVRYDRNRGKGYAVRTGIEKSRGKYVLFTDADNSTPIEEFEKFYPLLKHHEVVIGSRYTTGSDVAIEQPKYRIILGRLGNFLIRAFVLDDISDTQCGFKAFQHNAAKDIFSRIKVNHFGFDIEILSVARMLHYSICEVPISWYNSPESRVRPIKDALRTFSELVYIKLNLWGGRYE